MPSCHDGLYPQTVRKKKFSLAYIAFVTDTKGKSKARLKNKISKVSHKGAGETACGKGLGTRPWGILLFYGLILVPCKCQIWAKCNVKLQKRTKQALLEEAKQKQMSLTVQQISKKNAQREESFQVTLAHGIQAARRNGIKENNQKYIVRES